MGSRAEVDSLHADLKKIGATIVSPPREYPEYSPPGYYALFFKDLEGIKKPPAHEGDDFPGRRQQKL